MTNTSDNAGSQNRLRKLFFFIFAISGFSGLIYESIWTHYLKLFLGHAAYAQTLVLAIFMGGMATGAWLCSRYSHRWKNLFLMYAAAEAVIGISAVLFHMVFITLTDFSFNTIMPQLGNSVLVNTYKWTLASILILPQSILLGATFPLMSAAIIRRFPRTPGNSVSLLYFSNSLGGAIGVLTSGFFLIKSIGLPGTIFLAGTINLLLAAFMYFLTRDMQLSPLLEQKPAQQTPEHGRLYMLLLSVAFITGCASFIYEIGWIRMLSLVLGSSTHAFELMLSAFIFGLALGGLWIKNRIDKIKKPVVFLAWVQIVMGVCALSTLTLYGQSFNVMNWLVDNLQQSGAGYTLFNFASHAIALAIMLPATFCAGMTLPLLTHCLIKKGHGEKSIGIIYSSNTLGAIVGILFSVHIGMPGLGLKNLIISGAGIDILAGLILLWYFAGRETVRLPAAATVVGTCLILASVLLITLDPLKMASGVYRNTGLLSQGKDVVLQHKDGKTASVDLTRKTSGLVSIRTNGKTDAAVYMSPGSHYFPDEATMIMAAAIPLFMNPFAQHIAVVGMGSGLTSHVALQSRYAIQVDTIEIEQAMVDIARGFLPRNSAVYEDARSAIQIEDAKTYFSSNNKQYDIIISEPSNPWVSGVSGLFSEEFYALVNRHLNKDGILVQWMQLYEIDLELVASVLKALSKKFTNYDVYIVNAGDMLIVANNADKLPDLKNSLFTNANLARELRRIDINNIQDVMLRKIANKQTLSPLIDSYYINANSDFYPVLDQNAARTRFLNKNALELMSLALEPIPALELLGIRNPGWAVSNVSATPHFQPGNLVSNAQAIRDRILQSSNNSTPWFKADPQPHNTGAAEKTSMELSKLLIDCQTPGHGDKVFVLFDAALKLVPNLRPAELQQIWKRYENASCLSSWRAREKLWFDFFKSVSNRDAPGIAAISQQLLQTRQDLTPARLKYLVAANMLANISLGNTQLANDIWRNNRHELFPAGEPGILFRLMDLYSKGEG